jgi:hypothetical protein
MFLILRLFRIVKNTEIVVLLTMSTLQELRNIAKSNKLTGYSKMKKMDLEKLLSKRGLLNKRTTNLKAKTPIRKLTTKRKVTPITSQAYSKAKYEKKKRSVRGRIIVEVWDGPDHAFSVWAPLNQIIREGESKWGGHRYTLYSTDSKNTALFTAISYKALQEAAEGFGEK